MPNQTTLSGVDTETPTVTSNEQNTTGEGPSLSPLSSKGAIGSVTKETQISGLPSPTTLSGVKVTSIFSETPTSTSVEQTKTTETEKVSSYVSEQMTSGVTFSTKVHTFNALSTEQTTLDYTSTSQASVSNTTTTADYPTDCSGYNITVGQNAVHTIHPGNLENKTTLVNCVSTDDGLWTAIQRRFDGSVDFYRGWTDYKEGFGDASGEYWLGNEAIHQLTSRSSYKLKVVLKAWDNETAYAIYDTFQISDESDGYRLTYGVYNGDAGDSLTQHNGQMFSTQDRDNDSKDGRSCATDYTGAWWYGSCFSSNLNGRYFTVETGLNTVGSNSWNSFRPGSSLKETTMMIQKV